MIQAKLCGGVCGLMSVIQADSPDGAMVCVHIESECPQAQAMAADPSWAEMDAIQEILVHSLVETTPVRLAAGYRLHTTCLVPLGILKTIESAANLALPASSQIELTRIESTRIDTR